MQNFKPGTEVKQTFSLVNEAGEVLTPTALNWRVLDEAEVVLVGWTAITPMPLTSDVVVTVTAGFTTLATGVLRGIRTVELEIVTTEGTVLLSEAFMLQAATAMAFGVSTFLTYAQAVLTAEDFVADHMPGWHGTADRETREKSLIQAYQRLLKLPIGAHYDNEQGYLTENGISGPQYLRNMTPAQMATMYAPLLAGLRRAQVIEADHILTNDPVLAARENGLLSMTTGESSQFFLSKKPLELPVCKRAMLEVQRWVRFRASIGRS